MNVQDYWETAENGKYWPIYNEYDREKDLGVMRFEKAITEIPGISGHPFLHNQKNLLTLRLPNTITKIGRGAFWSCGNLNYINLVDLYKLNTIEREWAAGTNLTQIDLRNTKLTDICYLMLCGPETQFDWNKDYILLPETVQTLNPHAFSNNVVQVSMIKTLMTPTLSLQGHWLIEDQITENLIINKFDGLGDLHWFNGDVKIWVPDEFYDGYVEKYTNYIPDSALSKANCEDIVSRLKKYSEGVPEFPMK